MASQLVALIGETRVVLAKVGDTALLKGECKGMHGTEILVSVFGSESGRAVTAPCSF